MRPLGVGVVYWADLDPLARAGEVDVVEVEPQTLWSKSLVTSPGAYRLNQQLFESICALPQAKLLHGVGHPLAGAVDDPIDPYALLRSMTDQLDPVWVSEHMSFNRVRRKTEVAEAGFLLPPLQTPEGVRVAAAGVKRFAAALGRPTAFETGVNYFKPQRGELDDGEFFRAVADGADCGVVLDLHNLWCNQLNGRQSMRDALDQLPLDRVWELHFAGGTELDGYWLDAHRGRVPEAVLAVAADLIPRLPNLGALIYEILPEHLPELGLSGVERELARLRTLWALRQTVNATVRATVRPALHAKGEAPRDPAAARPPELTDLAAVRRWECNVLNAVASQPRAPCGPLAADGGAAILRRLIRDMRSANITKALRYTMTALVLACGVDRVRGLVDRYVATLPPDGFAAVEAFAFTNFLTKHRAELPAAPYLDEVLAFERALLAATVYARESVVRWTADPTIVLGDLDSGQLPRALPVLDCEMRVSV